MFKRLNLKGLVFFFGGMILLALGIRIISLSNLGLSFSDALFLKISDIFNIPASLASFILGVFTIIAASIILKKRPRFECLIISFIVGFFVDFWILIIKDISFDGILINVLVFLVGVIILSTGISIYLQPGYSPHPNDFLFMSIKNRFNISIFKAKILMDLSFGIFSILLMSKIGIGSIFNTLCLGIFINKGFNIFHKIYNK